MKANFRKIGLNKQSSHPEEAAPKQALAFLRLSVFTRLLSNGESSLQPTNSQFSSSIEVNFLHKKLLSFYCKWRFSVKAALLVFL